MSAESARIVRAVALLNLAYFGVEFVVATAIGSVALFADSIDFLEDASLNWLVLLALSWPGPRRARAGTVLSAILLVPVVATAVALWRQIAIGHAPAALPLSLAGMGAFAVNLSCALMLVKLRHESSSLVRAAFLSARNDVVANVWIVIAGLVTAVRHSIWPDVLVGIGIAALNIGAAREVYLRARSERTLAP